MEIKHIRYEKNGYFEAVENEKEVGKMTYTWAGDSKFIIDHTEVNANFNGKGIGKKLVMAAVGFARSNSLKIIPLCPFAKAVFDKTEEISDVLSS